MRNTLKQLKWAASIQYIRSLRIGSFFSKQQFDDYLQHAVRQDYVSKNYEKQFRRHLINNGYIERVSTAYYKVLKHPAAKLTFEECGQQAGCLDAKKSWSYM